MGKKKLLYGIYDSLNDAWLKSIDLETMNGNPTLRYDLSDTVVVHQGEWVKDKMGVPPVHRDYKSGRFRIIGVWCEKKLRGWKYEPDFMLEFNFIDIEEYIQEELNHLTTDPGPY